MLLMPVLRVMESLDYGTVESLLFSLNFIIILFFGSLWMSVSTASFKKKMHKNSQKFFKKFAFQQSHYFYVLIQFMENLSDRELEESLKSNIASKWFCEFNLTESTPNYSLFTRIRKNIGTNRLSKIFNILKQQLRAKGYMNEFFTFIDASHLISKASLWEERDKAIKEKYDKL